MLLLSCQTTDQCYADWLAGWVPWCYLPVFVFGWRYFDWGDTAQLRSVQLHLQFKPDLERLEGSLCWLIISEQNNNKLTGELLPTRGRGGEAVTNTSRQGNTTGRTLPGWSEMIWHYLCGFSAVLGGQFSVLSTSYLILSAISDLVWSGLIFMSSPALSILQAENDDGRRAKHHRSLSVSVRL